MKFTYLSIAAAFAVILACGSTVVAATNAGGASNSRSALTSVVKRPHQRQPKQQQQHWGLASFSSLNHPLRGGGLFASNGDDDHHDSDSDNNEQEIMSSNTATSHSVSVVPGGTLPPALSVKGGEDAATDMAMKSAKWVSFRNRAATAILMMAFLGFLSYYFKEDGLMVFTLLLQAMMYGEMTTVIGGEFTNPWQKWWWFLSATVAWNGPKIMPWKGTVFQAISYGMTIVSAIGATLQLNWTKSKAPAFREYIRQAAVVVLSSILVIFPTSYWIATLEQFDMMWIFVPALYMIINDTMAYVGGQLIGKHALLPSISPKKTWEGFLVAAASTVGVAWWLGTTNKLDGVELFQKLYPLDKMDGLALAVFSSLVAPFGGFLASIIKRAYGQKDFGALLPGHGGLVDRLDCQMLLAPAVYFYLTLYKFREGQV